MVRSLISPLRLHSKTGVRIDKSGGYRQSSKMVCRVYLSEPPDGTANLLGTEKSFCRRQIEDDQCLVQQLKSASFGWALIWQAQRGSARSPLVRLQDVRACCQGRSKTRPVGRSKSRPVVGSQVVGYSGEEGRWSVAEAALLPRGAFGGRVSVRKMGDVCGGSA
jgi:hypothetical protein